MTNTVEELAMKYAKSLIRFHELNNHVESQRINHGSALREDELALRRACDDMYEAQNDLNNVCRKSVEFNYD